MLYPARHTDYMRSHLIPLAVLVITAQAPTRYSAPQVRDFLPPKERRGLPVAKAVVQGNGWEQVALARPGDPTFGPGMPGVPGDGPLSDVSRTRLPLGGRPDAAEARLLPPGAPGGSRDYPSLVVYGAGRPLPPRTFETLVTDPALLPDRKRRNDILYNLNTGYYSRSYRFVGFARSHGAAYLGVLFLAVGPSDQRRGRNGYQFFLLRVRPDATGPTGAAVENVPLPPPAPVPSDYNDLLSGEPLFDAAEDGGDLFLLHDARIWRRGRTGTWRPTARVRDLLPPSDAVDEMPDGSPGPGRYTDAYLRGRWLVFRSEEGVREPDLPGVPGRETRLRWHTTVRVFDVRTRRPARIIRWVRLDD